MFATAAHALLILNSRNSGAPCFWDSRNSGGRLDFSELLQRLCAPCYFGNVAAAVCALLFRNFLNASERNQDAHFVAVAAKLKECHSAAEHSEALS